MLKLSAIIEVCKSKQDIGNAELRMAVLALEDMLTYFKETSTSTAAILRGTNDPRLVPFNRHILEFATAVDKCLDTPPDEYLCVEEKNGVGEKL
jgi:hypothetical protein